MNGLFHIALGEMNESKLVNKCRLPSTCNEQTLVSSRH